VIYPGEGHGVRKFPAYLDLVTRMTAWFERFIPARS
jgi:dipeptidyl aminopeptidase/acylaminoacyl peptidase